MSRSGDMPRTGPVAKRTPREIREGIGTPPAPPRPGEANGEVSSHCRSCAVPIIWAVTPAGRPVPVDSEPVSYRGNIRLDSQPDGLPLACIIPAMYCFGRHDLRLAHFVTCPEADKWRRRR